ncbi:hypothetical protein JB92DRAFT_3106906 [Gautieria morchelliformis]|nr:hypothetical protein JB92DRAFT_3106906 [Gautieria morchelliformis]
MEPMQDTLSCTSSYPPIPPQVFYGTMNGGAPHGTSTAASLQCKPWIDMWLAAVEGASDLSPSHNLTPSSASLDLPAVTPSLPQSSISSKAPKSMKFHEDFPIWDLSQLLSAVIDVNPYIAPWKKNGKVLAPWTALTCEANSHPAVSTSLSGWLDTITSIWAEAKELMDAQRVQAKKEKDVDKVAREDMRLAMMAMRKGTKRGRAS